MVLMGVCAHHIVQPLHPLAGQVGHDEVGIVHVAPVDEHGLPPAQEQGGVGLAHVDEMDLQRTLCRPGGGGRLGARCPAPGEGQGQQQP